MKIELTPYFLDSEGKRQRSAIMEVPDDADDDTIEELVYEYKLEFLQLDYEEVKTKGKS